MKFRLKSLLIIMCAAGAMPWSAAQAGSDFQVQSGKGEEVHIKQGVLGTNTFKVQDRIGDKIEHKSGWFGTGKTEVKVLGNGVETKKGLFGRKTTVTTMFGDKVETRKTWFGLGPRKTTMNLSGTSNMIGQLLGKKASVTDAPGVSSNAGAADIRP